MKTPTKMSRIRQVAGTTLKLVGTLFLLLLGWLYFGKPGNQRLQEAIAKTDRVSPRWRIEELEASRKAIDDDQNSALVVVQAAELLPTDWNEGKARRDNPDHYGVGELMRDLKELPCEFQLNHPQAQLVTRISLNTRPALGEARKLADLPWGRYRRSYEKGVQSASTNDVSKVSQVTSLLTHSALSLARDGEIDRALVDCRAMLNAERSIGDDPMVFPQELRAWRLRDFTITLERVLGLGEPRDDSVLARLDALLADEAKLPLSLMLIRNERAFFHDFMSRFTAGQTTLEAIGFCRHCCRIPSCMDSRILPTTQLFFRNNHAAGLEWLNEQETILSNPQNQQNQLIQKFHERTNVSLDNPWEFAKSWIALISVRSRAWAFQYLEDEFRARIGCARVLIALERHRLKTQAWPKNPRDLLSSELEALPLDPYGDGPIQIVRVAEGWRVFSIGSEHAADGMSPNKRRRIVFRLLDPDKRGKPFGRYVLESFGNVEHWPIVRFNPI